MIKNNWFNRTFHSKQVKANQEEANKIAALYSMHAEILAELKDAKTLGELVDFHKKIWNLGYRNANIGPCEYGIFRTKNIDTMTPDEVYLGNIYGLYTKNIPFWELHKEDSYGINVFGVREEYKIYDMIMQQYRYHLKSNIHSIVKEAKSMIEEYSKCYYIVYFQRLC